LILEFIIHVKLNRSSSDSDKKIHQGWGGDEGDTELKAEEAGKTDAQAEGDVTATEGWDAVPIDPWSAPPSADPWGVPAEGDNMPAAEDEKAGNDRKPAERELEDEESTMSYDQYLAQLKETTTTSVPKLEDIREANEGDGAWGDVVEHKKNEDDEAYYVGKV
jgi:plasminogen activator inhibitor 1 RNA-binding protein